jgi:signal transduction histidine kinase/ligand-binding sensor domain-containing protein/DNA-binding NarL/FixJ family response regulator
MRGAAALALAGACVLLLAMLPAALAAPAPVLEPPRRFDRWTTDNGLPQSSIYAITQTRDGYLWFTTLDGLVRFDGVRFTVYDASNTVGLAGNRFVCLDEGRDGTLWIGSEDGFVYAFDGGRATAYGLEDGRRPQIHAVREADDGVVWILTLEGVFRLDRSQPVARAYGGPLPQGARLWSLGTFAFGTDSTLTWLSGGGLATVGYGDGVPGLAGAHVSEDQRHRLWIRARDGRVLTIEDGAVRLRPLTVPAPPSLDSMPFCEDSRGNLWVGLYRFALLRVAPEGRQTVYSSGDGYDPTYRILAIFEDREGNIWLGSDGGLYRFRGDLISTISTRDGLDGDNANVVLEDSRGDLWVAGDGFLSRYRDGAMTRFDSPVSDVGRPTALLEDRDGAIWVGTRSSRNPILRFADGRFEALPVPGLVGTTLVNALYQDRDGAIWAGTSERLARLRPNGGFDEYTTADGLASDDVRALVDDGAGGLWVGTYGGLSRVVDGRVVSFSGQGDFAGERIRAIYVDAGGVLWVGTYDHGLIRYEGGRVVRFGKQTGLFSDGVFAILEDDAGYLWMSCNTGIYRVRKQQLDDVAAGRSARIDSVGYGRDDGMVRSECNGGKQPSAVRGRDGRLFFATQGGVAVIDPRTRPYNTVAPPVLIEEVVSGTARLDHAGGLRVEPDVENFEIRYTSPSFVKPELVRFRYRIDGLDDDWTEADTRRRAYFTYLPPGEYTFLVTAANCDGVWSAEPARLSVVVVAPFWRTGWAFALYALALGGLVYAGVRLRTRQLRRRSADLEQLVALRTAELAGKADELSETVERLRVSEHAALAAKEEALEAKEQAVEASRAKSLFLSNMSHELRTPLNALLGFVQLMDRGRNRSAEDRESLEIIHRSGKHLLGLINDVLSISKIEAGRITLDDEPFDFPLLLRSVHGMMQARAEAKRLALEFDLDPGLPAVVRGDEGKLRQVLVNLVGNAVKFTVEGSVVVRVRWDGGAGRAHFAIEDTGPGIAEADLAGLFEPFAQTETGIKAKEGTGLGLTISRQLVRLMGGDIGIASRPGEGATFRFDVPLPVVDEPGLALETRRVVGLAPGQASLRILVVDDTPENRKLLLRLLESVGFDVREASDGAEGVASWRSWQPDLIWMDMRMPVMDGHEAIRAIREAEALDRDRRPTTIVALTASAFEHQRDEILAIGADDFVPKPFREEAIFEKLAEHCGVRYVYEAHEPPRSADASTRSITAGRLEALPKQVRDALHAALVVGDGVAASSVVTGIAAIDGALAEEVAAAIRGYEFDTILRPLEESLARARTGPASRAE